MSKPHVSLVGLPGAGKSTVANAIAASLGAVSIDLDHAVELSVGQRVPEIFDERGEAGFRALEREVLEGILATETPRRVVACGGGTVLSAENRHTLRERSVVVWLSAPVEQLAVRLEASPIDRPLLRDDMRARLAALAEQRAPWYQEVADVSIDVGDRTPEQVVDAAIAAIVQLNDQAGRTAEEDKS